MMRIVLDLQACQAANRDRGIGRYSMSLARAMVRQAGEHEVRIVLNSRFPDTVKPICQAFDGLMPKEHLTVFDVPRAVAENDPAGAWRCRAAEKVRESYLAGLAPDIVHVSSLFEGWSDDAVTSAGLLVNSFDTAATLYDLIPLLHKETYLTDPQMRDWYYRKLQGLKNAELLLAISDYSRREAITALQLPDDRVVSISAAVDDIFRPMTLSLEESGDLKNRFGLYRPFLMYTGGIDYRKNIEGLIEAYALMPDSIRTKYQLAVICKIQLDERRRLESLALRFGLAKDDVVFTGFVTEKDLVALYNNATLFVFPSLHEGFGLPALEAMSCGVPVIGSNTSSIPEVIGREDALFDPADTHAIAAKIHQALGDDAFHMSLREHGLEQARKFTWDASAKRALEAFEQLHKHRQEVRRVTVAVKSMRPRLAYVSPLPPEKTGIADYSAELLPELARYYDIEVVSEQAAVQDHWIAANFPMRSVDWFTAHADNYDRIIYQFGNSAFHGYMFGLLARHPGIVVLHDFFLSGVMNYLDHSGYLPGALSAALYESHGYAALIEQQKNGRDASIWKYPCNKTVLDQAAGIIVHSRFSMLLAETWYGAGSAMGWRHIPHLRALPGTSDRQAARKNLGLADTDFLVCSFGLLGITKLNDRLLDAWLNSPLAGDTRCHLVFVGENDGGAYGKNLASTIAASAQRDRIKITGFAAMDLYRLYLAAADVAVQLRTRTRGETSGTVLDCLAYGLPTIVNAHGSSADLPDNVLLKLENEFSQTELVTALTQLWTNTALGDSLSHQGVEYIQREHHPARVGEMYSDAIEHFAINGPAANYQRMIRSLATMPANSEYLTQDMLDTAACIAGNRRSISPKQLLVDVSELVRRDAKSGIQRVVRNILNVFLSVPPDDYRVEPIYDAGGYYSYARRFTSHLLGVAELEDSPIEFQAGDMFLGLDYAPHNIPQNQQMYLDFANHGVAIYFVVYDLLPMLRPDVFVEGAKAGFERWLETVVNVSDGVVCISRSVADELLEWLQKTQQKRLSSIRVGYFHLGADIAADAQTMEIAANDDSVPFQVSARPSIIMVGTLEPRKGYAQALSAFEILWSQGKQINLVIVGKQGWMVEQLAQRLRNHPENGKRLFWFEDAGDALLLRLYEASAALLAASEGEGFGLPLIEAAQHKLPIIARDLPVFREVAGEHAFYFSGLNGDALATALCKWLALYSTGKAPSSDSLRWLTWTESANQLLEVLVKKERAQGCD